MAYAMPRIQPRDKKNIPYIHFLADTKTDTRFLIEYIPQDSSDHKISVVNLIGSISTANKSDGYLRVKSEGDTLNIALNTIIAIRIGSHRYNWDHENMVFMEE